MDDVQALFCTRLYGTRKYTALTVPVLRTFKHGIYTYQHAALGHLNSSSNRVERNMIVNLMCG